MYASFPLPHLRYKGLTGFSYGGIKTGAPSAFMTTVALSLAF
jgi:hypothetical protein